MNKKNQKQERKETPIRSVDKYFKKLDNTFSQGNKGLYALFLALAFFGFMGLIWMIPFPQFDFLIRMNAHTFLNWGSLFIAVVIYSYLKLAPTLSYAVLFCIAIMSFFIVQLEYVERDGGPSVVLVCSSIALVSLLVLFLLIRKEGGLGLKHFFSFMGLGPIWLWSKVFDKFKWKY
ncbi:hypothetical protein SAMN05660841_03917 [Sphingobacterium nematocida]|uniref:DUF962 domain-containing protein n=1 Tax=Sphingobacterium nematocida TaxID=1513896 RepID=A0A1T5GB36_9SPHI|nr:hypothetical protein [Sphingobacterium nematocida]SKC05615.1 hypothetical protein SAMN05660841_03917 [Sphingobacterium nematocida]